jgi:hypothetical protein
MHKDLHTFLLVEVTRVGISNQGIPRPFTKAKDEILANTSELFRYVYIVCPFILLEVHLREI